MNIEKQVCTFEQGKRLNELGLTIPSLHQWWKMKYPANENGFARNRAKCLITPTGDNLDRFIMHYIDNDNAQFHWDEGTYNDGWDHSRCELEDGPLNAYNVSELGEMLGEYIECVNKAPAGFWRACFAHPTIDSRERNYGTGTTCFERGADSEAEARAHLLIYLLENNLITAEQVNERLTK